MNAICGVNKKTQISILKLRILSIVWPRNVNELMASTHFYIRKQLWFYLTERITLQLTPCF